MLCIAHLVACIWLSATAFGAIRSIRARFIMFDRLGSDYFDDILKVGQTSLTPLPEWARRWLSSGKESYTYFFFYLLPLSGAAGTVYLLIHDVL